MFEWWITLILRLLWVFLHFLYHFLTFALEEGRWWLRHSFTRLLSCFPSHSSHRKVTNIFHQSRLLRNEGQKTPRHLGVVAFGKESLSPLQALRNNFKDIIYREGKGHPKSWRDSTSDPPAVDCVDLQALARVVSWGWIADTPIISVYDYNGHIKSNSKEFLHLVQMEISQNLWVVRERTKLLPIVKLHNVPVVQTKLKNGYANGYKNGYTNSHINGLNGISVHDTPEVLHICLFSYEDGMHTIVTTCKELYKELPHSKDNDVVSKSINELDEKLIDNRINTAIGLQFVLEKEKCDLDPKTEPDLMLVLGRYASTTGFLPWQIRLTEMHWLPSLKRFDEHDFLQSMLKYANCHQRFGT